MAECQIEYAKQRASAFFNSTVDVLTKPRDMKDVQDFMTRPINGVMKNVLMAGTGVALLMGSGVAQAGYMTSPATSPKFIGTQVVTTAVMASAIANSARMNDQQQQELLQQAIDTYGQSCADETGQQVPQSAQDKMSDEMQECLGDEIQNARLSASSPGQAQKWGMDAEQSSFLQNCQKLSGFMAGSGDHLSAGQQKKISVCVTDAARKNFTTEEKVGLSIFAASLVAFGLFAAGPALQRGGQNMRRKLGNVVNSVKNRFKRSAGT